MVGSQFMSVVVDLGGQLIKPLDKIRAPLIVEGIHPSVFSNYVGGCTGVWRQRDLLRGSNLQELIEGVQANVAMHGRHAHMRARQYKNYSRHHRNAERALAKLRAIGRRQGIGQPAPQPEGYRL